MRFLATSAVGLYLFVFVQIAVAASPDGACDLPQDLQREIASKYPGKKIVSLAGLQDYDRGFFQKDHNKSCPGLVKVDFYGDAKPTLASVFIGYGVGYGSSVLFVAHQVEAGWSVSTLLTGAPTA